MTTFRNDPDYRKLLKVYRACFQETHAQVMELHHQACKGPIDEDPKLVMMNALVSALVQAGIKFEKVGDRQGDPFNEEWGEGFFLVEDRFLVGTAFLQRLREDEIRVYLYDRSWTGIQVVLLNFLSEEPDWFSLDRSWPEPTFEEIFHESIDSLDEPDEYWLYMADPEAYDRLLDEELEDEELSCEENCAPKKNGKKNKAA
jgi:hypothetical protein